LRLLRNYKLRLMYVQDIDLRADSLINSRGNINPKSNAILQALIHSYHPTEYVDIGANYGEMIFNISKIENIKVYAFEPHPHIYECLKKSIEFNNITASIFNLAVGKESKTVSLIQKEAWSGTARIENQTSSNSNYENIFSVQLTSLDEIFINEALKRAITKIDVEGNEIEVLLGGVKYFSNSSNITLIEIIHLNKEQIQRILNDFNMYAYSRNLYKLYKIESYDSLHSMRSKIYGQDAILTLRPLNFNERVKLIVWAKYELLIYKILFNVINLVSKLKRAATV